MSSESDLHEQLEQLKLLMDISSLINTNIDFTEKIKRAIGELGVFLKADRIWIFEEISNGLALNNTYEWHSAGLSSMSESLMCILYTSFPGIKEKLLVESIIISDDVVRDFPPVTLNLLQLGDIKCFILLPILIHGNCKGFIALTNRTNQKNWGILVQYVLRTFVTMLSSLYERRFSTDALVKSEQRFREFAELLPEMVCEINIDGFITFANNHSFDNLGYSREDLNNNLNIFDIILAEDRHLAVKSLQSLICGKPAKNQEFHFVKKNGQVFPVIIYANLIEKNKVPVGLRAVIIDNTERKINEDKIKQSEQRFRDVVESAGEYIWEVDNKLNFTYLSDRVKQVLGYNPSELSGKCLFDLMPSAEKSRFRKVFVDILTTNSALSNFESQLFHKNGEIVWHLLSGLPIINNKNQIVGFRGVGLDITERKMAEEELRKAKDMAEEASRAKAVFLSTMSHELRTPLNAVIGLTYLLLQDSPKPEQIENLETLNFSAENLLAIINDILDYGKIEAGKVVLEEVEINLTDLLNRIKNTFKPKAQTKSINLSLMRDSDLPEIVMGDPFRLSQILNNLVSNAVKFTEKGRVIVSVNVVEKSQDRVNLHFSVKDSGIGISNENIDRIFEVFNQASSETTRKYGGTGLGLSITCNLLELMGSKIKVKSTFGLGSEFYFDLSMKIGKAEGLHSPVLPKEYKSLSGVRILLVEDNQVNQLVARKFLKRWDIEVDMADNGLIAVDKIIHNQYNLILMDLQMPEMDGFTAAKEIRKMQDEKFRNLPIIALTASAMLEIQDKVHESGMNDFLTKPFNPPELYAKIVKYSTITNPS
jgi:PAS domain S-box-containing protein